METEISNMDMLTLQLGDIIEIISPSNPEFHESTNYINYIDNKEMNLINVSSLKNYYLQFNNDGTLSEESIVQLNILSRSEEKGYARQNSLLPNSFVDIHFGGDFPSILSGEISNLEEDMIEIITYPELKTIYIDFKYQGIPKDLPIDKFVLREKPASLKSSPSLSSLKDSISSQEYDNNQDTTSIEFLETGESIIAMNDKETADPNVYNVLNDLYVEANTIVFGEDLGEISQLVEIPESEQKYSIEIQTSDMMDELLSTIPNSKRTQSVLNNIHSLIKRYVELRELYSTFDENNNIIGKKLHGKFYKPLVDKLYNLNYKLNWIVPIVQNTKKIDIDNDNINNQATDVLSEDMNGAFKTLVTNKETYLKKGSNDQSITYDYLQNKEKQTQRPFENPITDDCITIKEVQENFDVVVDNLNDFYSSVYKNASLKKTKYVIQRYNLGETKMKENIMKSGKKIYTRDSLTRNDEVCIKSFLTLPKSIVQMSEIHLPSSSIIRKTDLHNNYLLLFKLLNKNTNLSNVVLNDLSKTIDYEQMENEDKKSLFENIHEFIIDTENIETIDVIDNNTKYRNFLEAIIPHTRVLIKLYKKHIKNAYSFVDVITKMEPFSIYPTDINYGELMEIRFFIKEQITELKKEYATKLTEFNNFKNARYNVDKKVNAILRILAENNSDFSDTFFKHYKFLENEKLDTKLSTSEILFHMTIADNIELYTSMIASILIGLNSPDDLLTGIKNSIEDMGDSEKIKSEECGTLYLSNKYTSIKDLQKDNDNDELYFDSDLDDTPYEIMKQYEKQQSEMPTTLFFSFLVENLVQRHSVPSENAETLAETLIANKKKVRDGHYAILELYPKLKDTNIETLSDKEKEEIQNEANIRKKTFYYRRLKNNWIKDEDISEESFFDTNTIFCNLSTNCLKNTKNKVCESADSIKIRIKNENTKTLKSELANRYETTLEELEQNLNERISKHLKQMRRESALREINEYRANNLHYEIGKLVNKDEQIESKYAVLRDRILGHADFAKKQELICLFVDKYTRSPFVENLDEDPFWFYCKETNTKLFPTSLWHLAKAYITGLNYVDILERVVADIGTLSEDQSSIVDKHSGYELKKIEYSDELGYDEVGRKIQTHEIMEKDITSIDTKKQKTKLFENENVSLIYNICKSICENIDIPCESVEENVIRFSQKFIDLIEPEAKYKRRSEANFRKEGKYLQSYQNHRNETILIIIGAVLHTMIQTAVPSFQTKKTFPSCVRSFSGYPMTGIEDLTGIIYISCVLLKMKSSIPPWNSLTGMKREKMTNRIKDMIETFVYPVMEIQELYIAKKNYMNLNPDLVTPEEHAVQKWVHYLPPLIKTKILPKLKNITNEFKKDIVEKIKKGDPRQHLSLYVIQTKNVHNGYALIEIINNIVDKKDTLLKTAGKLPFLENACCIDKSITNPILYFNTEDNNVKVLIARTIKNTQFLKNIQGLGKARMFTFTENTIVKYPELPSDYLEENVYHAFIHYCNFDKSLPIPYALKDICSSVPDGYNKVGTIEEKMEFLKRNGKRFNLSQLEQLMTVIRKQNLVSLHETHFIRQADAFNEIIDSLELNNSEIIEKVLRDHLKNVLSTFEPKKMYDTPNQSLDNLTNYLLLANRNIYKSIMEFIDTNGKNIYNKDYDKMAAFLLQINTWNMEDDLKIQNVSHYFKNTISNICKIYPTLLSNNADFYKYICKHWNFSQNHNNDILNFVNKYGKNIEKFKNDAVLLKLLQDIDRKMVDMIMFVKHIPKHTEITKTIINEDGKEEAIVFHNLFDNLTYFELLKHCFYKTIYEFIISCDDVDLLRTEIKVVKDDKIKRNENIGKAGEDIESVRISVNEDYEDVLNELEENDIVMDSPEELKSRISYLLFAICDVEMENKACINYSYKDIMKKVNRSKEREKKGIIEYLGAMSKEERKVEELFKMYKLGRWNVGQQRGLISYDKGTYERERQELIQQLFDDENEGRYEIVSEMRRELFDDNENETEEVPEDNEGNDITMFGEDYMDGVYYPEDNEE